MKRLSCFLRGVMRTLRMVSLSSVMRKAGDECGSGRKSCRKASSISRNVEPGTTAEAGMPTALVVKS